MVKAKSIGNRTMFIRKDSMGLTEYSVTLFQYAPDRITARVIGYQTPYLNRHYFTSRREAIAFVGGFFNI